MYRYILVLFSLSFTYASAWSEVPTLETLVGKDDTLVQCRTYGSWGKLSAEGLKKLDEVSRARTKLSVCRGAQCALKRWPEDQGTGRSLCQVLVLCAKKLS